MITDVTKLRTLVKIILSQSRAYQWTVQGLGMLRLYLGNEARLHIWDSELEYPNVSKIHNHSWREFNSTVISGRIWNQKYVIDPSGSMYYRRTLVCGMNHEWAGEPVLVNLSEDIPEIIDPGENYSQVADEIHETEAIPGTVTLMYREYDGPKGTADVFWPVDTEWGTAEPRAATEAEVIRTVNKALELLK